MKKWYEIKVGDLVRCKVMPIVGLGMVTKITQHMGGQATAICYWTTIGVQRTYFLDQLECVEEQCKKET